MSQTPRLTSHREQADRGPGRALDATLGASSDASSAAASDPTPARGTHRRSELDLDDLPVELVHWPRERERREALVRAGIPVVLLVPAGAEPPRRLAIGEDWIRVPADERDLFVRAARVRRHLARLAEQTPVLDASGVLHRGALAVALSASEATALEVLLADRGRVVERTRLEQRVWPQGAPSERALDSLLYRLRRRLLDLGLIVSSSRGRGFVLEIEQGGRADPSPGGPAS